MEKGDKIIIEKAEFGFNVTFKDRLGDGLNYEEVMGVVACLTMPDRKPSLNYLRTREEEEKRRASIDEYIFEKVI